MGTYTLTATSPGRTTRCVQATRAALADQGFGILTEIDLAATMKAKLDVDLPPQVILGACRPPLAYEAIQVDPSIAAVLPCNVVVRSVEAGTTVVEAFDPDAMMGTGRRRRPRTRWPPTPGSVSPRPSPPCTQED